MFVMIDTGFNCGDSFFFDAAHHWLDSYVYRQNQPIWYIANPEFLAIKPVDRQKVAV